MSQTIGHGSVFQLGSGGGSETFTPIDGTTGVTFGSDKVDAIDTTELSGGYQRTFIGGLENSGDVSVKINVKPGNASQTSLFTAKDTAAHNFKVIYPGATRTRAFSGIILSIDEDIPDDKLPTYTVKIQVTGAITNS